MAKMRAGVGELEGGGGVSLLGVGAMEVAEGRGFIGGVVDGLRYVVLPVSSIGAPLGSLGGEWDVRCGFPELMLKRYIVGRLELRRSKRGGREKRRREKMGMGGGWMMMMRTGWIYEVNASEDVYP